MKLRPHHTAALALFGWYLMTPPPEFDLRTHLPIPGRANTDESSFRFWETQGNFDSAEECETARRHLLPERDRIEAEIRMKHHESKEQEAATEKQMDRKANLPAGYHHALRNFGRVADENAKCVATDDPRLR